VNDGNDELRSRIHDLTPTRTARRVRRRLALVFASLVLALMLVRAGPALVVSAPLAEPEAIISLASHEWERLPAAARLASEHADAVILLTKPTEVSEFSCHDCANRAHRLGLLGVPEGRVRYVTLTGPGTHGEAVAALGYARASGLRRLTIVTSPYHTRRSLAVFRKVFEGTDVEIGIEPALADSVARPDRWWVGGYDRAYVVYEWAAIAYYLWSYGVPV
jgi:uncharacterized SAM-binding protein YcdF (DUF218 family)